MAAYYGVACKRYIPCSFRSVLLALLVVVGCSIMLDSLEVRAQLSGPVPRAQKIQFLKYSGMTRVRLHLSRSLRVAIFSLPQPYRLVLDFPIVDFSAIEGTSPGAHSILQAFRAGLIAPNQSRIVLDARGPFKLVDVRTEKSSGGGSIVILDLRAVTATSFRTQGVVQRLAPSMGLRGASFPVPRKKRGMSVIVVDPGHGGLDPGAIGVGRKLEKDIALAAARQLVRVLLERKHYKVIMTRDKDVFVSLDDRVAVARLHKADLFISLHADAVARTARAKRVRGASVYTLARVASDDRAKAFAEKENASDVLAGLPIAPTAARGRIEAILFDLMRRETTDFSLSLRNHLVRRMKRSMHLSRSPRRAADFRVLWQPETPSVLIELGYMSNPKDVREMVRVKWQAKAAEAIALAVDAYFEERGLALTLD